jgi:hypothetical protein
VELLSPVAEDRDPVEVSKGGNWPWELAFVEAQRSKCWAFFVE